MVIFVHCLPHKFKTKDVSFNSDQKLLLLVSNPFVPNALFLYPFQRVEKGCIGNEFVNFGL